MQLLRLMPLMGMSFCLTLANAVSLAEDVPAEQPNVFDLPILRARQIAAHRQITRLIGDQDYAKAEELLATIIKQIPHDQTAHYNMACVLARQSKTDEAFQHLQTVGVFVHNGDHYSAPAFVSLFSLDNGLRTYDDNERIQSVDYRAESVKNNYVDPLIDIPKDWRDEYHYADDGTLMGWTRTRENSTQEFTAEGELIIEPGKENSPPKTAPVRYVAERLPNNKFLLRQEVAK